MTDDIWYLVGVGLGLLVRAAVWVALRVAIIALLVTASCRLAS